MRRRLSQPIKIVIEIMLRAGLVFLFIIVLDPIQLRHCFPRVTLKAILGLLIFQPALHAVGMLQWVVLLRQSGIRRSAGKLFWARLSGCAVTSLTPSSWSPRSSSSSWRVSSGAGISSCVPSRGSCVR